MDNTSFCGSGKRQRQTLGKLREVASKLPLKGWGLIAKQSGEERCSQQKEDCSQGVRLKYLEGVP